MNSKFFTGIKYAFTNMDNVQIDGAFPFFLAFSIVALVAHTLIKINKV